MDPYMHPIAENHSNSRFVYPPPPSPRFPEPEPERRLRYRPLPPQFAPPEHHHHRRPLPPFHNHSSHNSLCNNPFPQLPAFPSTPRPPVLPPPPVIFPPRPLRVSDSERPPPFTFRKEECTRFPPLGWEGHRLFPRPPSLVDLDSNDRVIRFHPPDTLSPNLVRGKRFHPDLEGLEFKKPRPDFAGDARRDSWGERDCVERNRSHDELCHAPRRAFPEDPYNDLDPMPIAGHHRSHDELCHATRRAFPEDPYNDLDPMPIAGHHGYNSPQRRNARRKSFDGQNVKDRIPEHLGSVEFVEKERHFQKPISGLLSNSVCDEQKEFATKHNGTQIEPAKRIQIADTCKGKMIIRNKPQKVSALLRIQEGDSVSRKMNDRLTLQSPCFDSNAAALESKGPANFSNEKLEKASPTVELDVSFKSNALVGKASFTPSVPGTVSTRKRLTKTSVKKKRAVDSVTKLPAPQGPIIDCKDTEGEPQDSTPAAVAADCAKAGDRGIAGLELIEIDERQGHAVGCGSKCPENDDFKLDDREELGALPLEIQNSPIRAMEDDGRSQTEEEGLHQSNDSFAEALFPPDDKSNIERPVRAPDRLAMVPNVPGLNEDQSCENVFMDKSKRDDEATIKDNSSPAEIDSSALVANVDGKSDDTMLIKNQMVTSEKLPMHSLNDRKSTSEPVIGTRNLLKKSSGSLPPRASFIPRRETISLVHSVRPRTWHRADSSSASPSLLGNESSLGSGPRETNSKTKVVNVQMPSYIRKGNSLVRKPTRVVTSSEVFPGFDNTIYRPNSASDDETSKSYVAHRSGGSIDKTTIIGGGNLSFDKPRTPALSHTTSLTRSTTNNCRDTSNTVSVDPPAKFDSDIPAYIASDAMNVLINEHVQESVMSENKASYSFANNLGMPKPHYGKLKSPKAKKLIYVKRKSNQLVAAPPPEIHDSTASNTDKAHAAYFKRRKNQLVRNIASSKSHSKQITLSDDMNSDGQSAPEMSKSKGGRSSVSGKTSRPSKLSFAGNNLTRSQSHCKDVSFQYQRVLPCLFPWKRITYWRRSISKIASTSKKSSLSLMRKLKLSRQRETVYTRSTSGFSLRKSGVLSIGRPNLKWSKSIERSSKKANEEATKAVAAAERRRREIKQAAYAAQRKSGGSSHKLANGIELQPGERIFCVGSVRYKMDSSKKTLLRIADEDSSSDKNHKSVKGRRLSFVPRRLLIGNDEYIRIGNGNQLVRDPKKLTRILASEKVRWSLHTARLRLAKKQQYCQFFTRFGKCNKEDGKCPYIHDSAKVVVCTKFLTGRCSNANCKLTHKVIPERMPDCSYFLQGLCTNEKCPYRHVNVNPTASVCEGFLKGYCAGGDECRKKHTYVCPSYEAERMCPQGSSCKLHHPKMENKSRKRKQPKDELSIIKCRYFKALRLTNNDEPETNIAEGNAEEKIDDVFVHDGRYADYVSLDLD